MKKKTQQKQVVDPDGTLGEWMDSFCKLAERVEQLHFRMARIEELLKKVFDKKLLNKLDSE